MDNSQIVLWGRTIERLLTVGFSGLSIVLGWSLFKARLLKDQTAEFTSKSWTLRLERVGPGIFFALFGVLGLLYAQMHPLHLTGDDKARSSAESRGGIEVNYSGPGRDDARNELRAINTIDSIAIPAAEAHPNSGERAAVEKAKTILDSRKQYLLRLELGDSLARYEKWKTDAETDPSATSKLSRSDAEEFRRADELAKGTFLGADK
jgi:hypothetical protein